MKEREKKLYFNKYEFEKVKKIAEMDPNMGLIAYQNYIEKYPQDYSSYLYYISFLIMLGHFEEAEKLLNVAKALYFTASLYQKNEEKARLQNYNIHFCTIKLLAYQNKISELLEYYDKHYEEIKDIGSDVKFYYESLLEKKDSSNRENNSYLFRQILEYKESDFKEHIKKHMADYNNNQKCIKNIFCPDFPINDVIEEIKKYIPSDKRLNTGFIQNVYVFKYDGCGRDNNKLVDYFVVVVFNNTCNFITMCPSSGYENYSYVDLNYMKEKKDSVNQTKVLSRIDKFNQRYKRNV